MAYRKAKKNITTSDDFFLISRHKDLLKIEVHNNDSPNIIADLAVANKPFAELLRAIVKSIDNENESKANTDQPSEGGSEQSENPKQGSIPEAEIID
jgi:hypothetical protein